ncbi:MAG: IclR family transcriptional regulator [Propionibacteriaceae bacterium]|nr:IclR family transcriptional regulator [Propionibacteriaceae bacterium]
MSRLGSVDNALRLILLLNVGDSYSVTEVAQSLGVAPSTAHRLLDTLVQRGFATQAGDRRYSAGPAITRLRDEHDRRHSLARLARRHLHRLARSTNETCHLVVGSGREVRFLVSEEGGHVLRTAIRTGQLLPAHLTASGKVLLADLSPADLARLYPVEGVPSIGLDADDVAALRRDIASAQQSGLAVNRGATERGVYAMAVAIRPADGAAVAALVVSLPMVRQTSGRTAQILTALRSAAARLAADIDREDPLFDRRPALHSS